MRLAHLISFIFLLLLVERGGMTCPARPDLRADRLQTGVFRYRETVGGKEEGQGEIHISRLSGSGNYRFANVETGAFAQSWEAVVAPDFSPISASLAIGRGAEARPAFELTYRGGRVTGIVYPRKGQEAVGPRKVDEPVAADTVDQRIDWAAAMALDEYVSGRKFECHVYDPGTGNSRDVVQIGTEETLVVPAGTFHTIHVTYTIEKNRGSETYEAWISKQTPRFLVREKFPDGSLSELFERKPL